MANSDKLKQEFIEYTRTCILSRRPSDKTKFILKLARTMDLTINLRHIMNFGKAKFKAKILNDNSLVTNMDEFLRVAAKYV